MKDIMESTDNIDISEGTEETATLSPSERMKGIDRFKDKEYGSSDEALNDVLDALEEVMPQSVDAEKMKKDMVAIFKKHPEIPYLISVAEETGDFQTALQSLYDNDEDMLMRESDDGYENVKKIRTDRIDKYAKEQELLDKYNSNMENFPAMFDEWANMRKLSEEDKNGMYAFLDDMLVKLVSGDVDKDVLDKVYQAYSYKRDIGDLEEDNAIAEANVENEKSAEKLLNIPDVKSPATARPEVRERGMNPLDEIYNAKKGSQ